MPNRPHAPSCRDDFEIAIICALLCERNAVEAAFDEFWDEDEGGDRYGRANGDQNHYITGRMGANNIVLAYAAVSMRSSYVNIRLALVVGVCGGDYDFGRQHPDKFVRKDSVEDNLGRPNKDIRNLVAVFELDRGLDTLEERSAQILQGLQQNLPLKRSGKYDCPRAQISTQSPGPAVHVHTGVIASGDLVLRSATHRNKIFKETKAIGFEMEGAGVWDEVPCIVIKGVCDYADSQKNKDWQDYAAATAALVSKAVLERYLQTDKAIVCARSPLPNSAPAGTTSSLPSPAPARGSLLPPSLANGAVATASTTTTACSGSRASPAPASPR
ncbi:nucleoside phosphorylase domain-containing protein [Emericellopsis atlantica]|uniref:Nucleoside phosphorylase domain-containing protein n=1 Tax=Emericellopsis atlantica TaxID=2614577 RepID=A0A9P7ZF27_9HYPO|nr:nucleoside phosphorylase domain-containing protein [Emericellopsis atlantica]KAG9250308.1 nucleoside phosphorylase domain-containing protein [Emericellopsis atlantica]